ncbi:MAG: type VI secretion system baseplate subunit TssF [Verrucomicrobiota bacterium]
MRAVSELYCTPAINLFEKTPDRILLSNRFLRIPRHAPDRNRPLHFEVYSVKSVTGFGETPDQEQEFHPFYKARDTDLEARSFYTSGARRVFSDRERLTGRRSSYAGTDAFISIVDGDMAPCRTNLRQLGIKAWCTNRHLPIQMVKGVGRTDFEWEMSVPLNAVRILFGPSLPKPSLVLAGQDPETPQVASGRFAWRIISHLSLNYLSLLNEGPETGAEGLREILRLYADPNDRQTHKQIDGIRAVEHRPILRRVETPGPITFARGLEIAVHFDESAFEGQGVFVLGAVLEQFFARYASLNSFTETVIVTQQRKEIMRWPSQMGRRQIL